MNKKSEDQPAKHVPSAKDLSKLAEKNPRADQDTSYQDNKGKTKETAPEKSGADKKGG